MCKRKTTRNWDYPLVIQQFAMDNPLQMEVLIGKSSINGPFPMAMLNNQRVIINDYLKIPMFIPHNAFTYPCWCGFYTTSGASARQDIPADNKPTSDGTPTRTNVRLNPTKVPEDCYDHNDLSYFKQSLLF